MKYDTIKILLNDSGQNKVIILNPLTAVRPLLGTTPTPTNTQWKPLQKSSLYFPPLTPRYCTQTYKSMLKYTNLYKPTHPIFIASLMTILASRWSSSSLIIMWYNEGHLEFTCDCCQTTPTFLQVSLTGLFRKRLYGTESSFLNNAYSL